MIPHTEKTYFLQTQENWDKPAKISSNTITIGCPICEEGKSKGKKQRCSLYYYNDNLMVHCFNCGIHHHFPVYLKTYFPNLYRDYMISSGFKTITDNYKISEKEKKELKFFKIEDLNLGFIKATESSKAMTYLYSRGVDTKFFNKFYYTKNYRDFGEGIIIPFYADKEKIYGFQYRSLHNKRFFIYLPESNKGYKIYNYFTSAKKVYVFESVFDLYSNDIPLENKISSFGSDIDIKKLNKFNKVVFCFDNDETGLKKAEKYLNLGFDILIYPDNVKFKDFNEMLQFAIKKGQDPKDVRYKIKRFIEKNIFSGLEAKIKLKLNS